MGQGNLIAERLDLRLGLLASLLDLVLAGEEDEDVTLGLAQVDLRAESTHRPASVSGGVAVAKACSETTGPKISSCTQLIVGETWPSTVGSR